MILASLIAKLEAAPEGSRELDEQIALATRTWTVWLSKHRRWNFDSPNDRHFSWPQSSIPLHDTDTGRKIILSEMPWPGWADEADLPEWSTSLDAALPGENIVEVYHLRSGAWMAVHQAEVSFEATAATEPLARRIAALKARE